MRFLKRFKNKEGKITCLSVISVVLLNAVPLFYAFTCILPVAWLFYSTFKTMTEFSANVLALPKSWTNFVNYEYVLTRMNLLGAMFNTVRISVIVVTCVVLFAFINGYFLARFQFFGKRFLAGLYTCNLFIPVHAILIPTYILFSAVGLYNQWYSTILPCICMEVTTTIFLVRGYIESMPKELEEAAAIDGSSFSRTLFTIIMPIAKPVLATCAIICFFHVWNEFPFSLILFNREKLYTLPLALMRFKGDYVTDYPRVMTSMFISILPAFLIYLCFSKQIMKGMMAGAVKG